MAVIDSLETAKANIALRIAEVTAEKKPTYSVDGKSVSWESYLATLNQQMEMLNKMIQVEGGPQWLSTIGVI